MTGVSLERHRVVAVADETIKRAVHARLVAEAADGSPPSARELRGRLAQLVRDEQPLLTLVRLELLVDELVAEVAGLGPLEPLLADPTVTEVMVNGPAGRSSSGQGASNWWRWASMRPRSCVSSSGWSRRSGCVSIGRRRWSTRPCPMGRASTP
jgi:hypothetical protein